MLDKSDIEQNLRLSPPASSKEPSLIEQLETTIADVRDNKTPSPGVAVLVMQALQELLRRTEPKMGMIPPLDYTLDAYPLGDDWFNEAVSDMAKNDAELHK